ncbi:MAG TPA: cell division protein FtsL [Actinomycetes bacterium]|nr:cell division protein FtsL [Actinomycetes bacterium]
MIGLLIAGLGSLLLLNTLLAQGSFTVHDLDQQVALLTDREQALQQQVARLAAPDRLAHKAAGMGMVPAINPAFVRAGSGRILGVPTVGVARVTPAPVTPAPVTPTTDPLAAATSNQQSGSTAKKPDKKRGQKPGKSTASGQAGGQ